MRALCGRQGGAVELEAKDAGHILLRRPLGADGRVGHEQQVRECRPKEGPIHIPLIHGHVMSQERAYNGSCSDNEL